MQILCRLTGAPFTITAEDAEIYSRLHIPRPTHCPEERLRRRLVFRNERRLYHRSCDATGKRVISFYAPELKFPVYDKDYWWSDSWDPYQYGKPFDFSRPFFEQFAEFRNSVPRMNIFISHCEDSDYCPYSVYSRRCFMAVSCFQSEDVHFSYQTNYSRDCLDCGLCLNCELCYECLNCTDCYNVRFSHFADNCSNSWFLKDCIGCSSCFGCSNLRNKQYHLFNEPVGKERFQQALESFGLDKHSRLMAAKEQAEKFLEQSPVPFMYGINNENASGHNIRNCKNAHDCFDVSNLEDCRFIYVCPPKDAPEKDCRDLNYSPGCELVVDGFSVVNNYHCAFNLYSWDMRDSFYSEDCFYSSNLFGCVGLRQAQYCIFNKSYSPEEYASLRQEIISHMQKTGEWGEFFPATLSPYAYNECIAQDHFPLSEKQAQERGYRWRSEDVREYQPQQGMIEDSVKKVDATITSQLLACLACSRNYKIQKPELNFYQNQGIPIPRKCPECRYQSRMRKRNPWRLIERPCSRCGTTLKTSYLPEVAQNIMCSECYQVVVS